MTPATSLDDIASSTEETLALYGLARALTAGLNQEQVANVIANHVRRVVPASTCAFYAYDEQSDELVCAHVVGENATLFTGLRMARGQRLSGWVAANRRTILNSDPVLDLGEIARSMRPRLRSCLSTPFVKNDHLVGVLTLYSTQQNAFDENHRRVIEAVARQVANIVGQAIAPGNDPAADGLVGLPNRQQLQRFVQSELSQGRGKGRLSLVFVTLDSSGSRLHDGQDHHSGRTIDAIRRTLREGDIVFRYSRRELVLLLSDTDSAGAAAFVGTIAANIAEGTSDSGVEEMRTAATFGVATAPLDGTNSEDLVRAARNRVIPDSGSSSVGSIH